MKGPHPPARRGTARSSAASPLRSHLAGPPRASDSSPVAMVLAGDPPPAALPEVRTAPPAASSPPRSAAQGCTAASDLRRRRRDRLGHLDVAPAVGVDGERRDRLASETAPGPRTYHTSWPKAAPAPIPRRADHPRDRRRTGPRSPSWINWNGVRVLDVPDITSGLRLLQFAAASKPQAPRAEQTDIRGIEAIHAPQSRVAKQRLVPGSGTAPGTPSSTAAPAHLAGSELGVAGVLESPLEASPGTACASGVSRQAPERLPQPPAARAPRWLEELARWRASRSR